MNRWPGRLWGWDSKATLICGLVMLIVLILSIAKTVAAPSPSPKQKADSEKVEMIKSKPMEPAVQHPAAVEGLDTLDVALPPIHSGLGSSDVPQLQRLAEYEKSSGGAVASGMMVFTDIPASQSDAQSAASDIAKSIIEFDKYGIEPIVIMEPTINGTPVSFPSYRNGAYDAILNKYFSTIKTIGITDAQMGTWVYFPEANLPEWGPVDTLDFAPNVVRTVNIQKNYFPASRSSILLDAQSYPPGSAAWDNGSYVSLSPYVSGIPSGMLNSFGLQGFPWAPPANEAGPASYDPSIYLKASLASQAAQILGVGNAWFNTGTYGSKYTKDASRTIHMLPAQRQALLNGVVAQAAILKDQGYVVEVNLFSEDKSTTAEATDWSYGSADNQAVFKAFAGQLYLHGIALWLFDA